MYAPGVYKGLYGALHWEPQQVESGLEVLLL